ncbi:hypothetical protein GQ600_9390 [Phytophthora cactorum]|nr:hypothetical protein GQ600_9390 [Phytophthora cactorum]
MGFKSEVSRSKSSCEYHHKYHEQSGYARVSRDSPFTNSVAELFKPWRFHEFDRLLEGSQSGELRVEGVELPTEPDQLPTEPISYRLRLVVQRSEYDETCRGVELNCTVDTPHQPEDGDNFEIASPVRPPVVQSKMHPRRKPSKIVNKRSSP